MNSPILKAPLRCGAGRAVLRRVREATAELHDQGRIRVNDDVLYYEAQGPSPTQPKSKPKYEPCAGTRLF